MGENVFFYDHRTEKLLRDRPSTSSSDSEEFGLIIDLEMNHCKTNSNKECNNDEDDDDALSIGCEENETSVNFFIKVEKPPEQTKTMLNQKCTSTKKSNPNQKKCVVSPTDKLQLPSDNKCNKCKFESPTINGLFIHFSRSHPTENFVCSKCPYETKLDTFVYDSVYEHMKSHYIECVNSAVTYKCRCCKYVTSDKSSFREHRLFHVKMKKEKEAKFQCPICSYSRSFFATLNHFKTHAKEHKDLKNIRICPVCNMKVKNIGKHAKHHIKMKFDDDTEMEEEENKDENKKKKKYGDDPMEETITEVVNQVMKDK